MMSSRASGKLTLRDTHPSRKTASTTHFNELYSTVVKEISQQAAKIDHFALTTDGWTGLSASFWSVTAQGFDHDFQLHHFKLGCIPIFAPVHSADVVAAKIQEKLKEFGIDPHKVSAVTTDEGGCAPLIAGQFSSADEIHCGAHLLNTALRNAFEEICKEEVYGSIIKLILEGCRELSGTCNRSTQLREQLTTNQLATGEPVLTLKQDVSTRWNSILYNISSVLQSKTSIMNLCANNLNLPFAGLVIRHGSIMWPFLQHLQSILQQFEQQTRDLCLHSTVTASQIVVTWFRLRYELDEAEISKRLLAANNPPSDDAMVTEMVRLCLKTLLAHLNKKFLPFQPAELIAFALDPLNPQILQPSTEWDFDWNNYLEQGYQLILQQGASTDQEVEIIPPTNPTLVGFRSMLSSKARPKRNSNVGRAVADLEAELQRFRDEDPVVDGQCTAEEWWRSNKDRFPLLSKLARKYLAFPASQSASERDFSQMRLMCTHLRSQLDPERAFRMSIVGPYLRAARQKKKAINPRSQANQVADARRNASRKQTRQRKLRNRFAHFEASPDLQLPAARELDQELNQFVDIGAIYDDTGERSSDYDYEFGESESSDAEEISNDFEDLQPVRKVARLDSSVITTRSNRIYCNITQSQEDRFAYIASFVGLGERTAPTPEALFGANFRLITQWKAVFQRDIQYWGFRIHPDAEKIYSSGKEFLREIGHVISVTNDMLEQL
jgi:hypothetical protein